MTVHAGPLLGPDASSICCYDPALDGTMLCGHPADIHILVSTDLGEEPEFTTYSCLEHAEFARASSIGSHITDTHPVGTQCIGATPETTLWRYSTETVTGACIERTEHTVSKFIGRRRSTEASVVLSSVAVGVQRLDADGAPVGEEIELGRLVVNQEGESVGLELPGDDQAQGAPGFKLFVRERGRESRTTVTELRFDDTFAAPEPEEPTDPEVFIPGAPRNLTATDVTRTSATLRWEAPAESPVHHFEIFLDGELVGVGHVLDWPLVMAEPGEGISHRLVQVRAVSHLGVASTPAGVQIPVPPREPDPEPEPSETPWPAPGTVGFLGDRSTLQTIRGGQITTPNTVIEDKIIDCRDSGEIGIRAANVVFRRCVFLCGGWGIFLYNEDEAGRPTNGLVVEDCTFEGAEYAAIGLSQAEDWRISRCDFSGGNDAIKPGGSGVIEDSRMHDPYQGENSHNDCIQFSGDCDGITVRRCALEGADTSEIAMFQDQGGVYRNVEIYENYLGGAGYAIYAGGRSGHNIVIRDNAFGPYGSDREHPVTLWQRKEGNVFADNYYLPGGAEVPVPAHEA